MLSLSDGYGSGEDEGLLIPNSQALDSSSMTQLHLSFFTRQGTSKGCALRHASDLKSLECRSPYAAPASLCGLEALDVLSEKFRLPWSPHLACDGDLSIWRKTFDCIGPTILKPCTLQMGMLYQESHLIIILLVLGGFQPRHPQPPT